MNRAILLTVFAAAFSLAPLHAEPKAKQTQPIVLPEVEAIMPSTPRVHEFQGDEISLVLRTLARSARVTVVISDQVRGAVTARIENKTPREAIEIVAAAKELLIEDKEGVLYVSPKNPPPPGAPKASDPENWDEALSTLFTPALTKMYDSLLDYHARPETAQKIAKGKKALYDALIAEGFTKDEAFRIILTNQEVSIPSTNN